MPVVSVVGGGKVYELRGGLLGGGSAHRAFGPLDLELHAGECVALAGRSGAGKSTLARCLAGLEPLSEGGLRWGAMVHRGGAVPGVQLVMQDSPLAMNPWWSIREILEEPLQLGGHRGVDARLRELVDSVGLPDSLLQRRADQLSGGQRRRVLLARALAVAGVRVLLLDEPFAGLDEKSAQSLAKLISELREEKGLALLLITHELASVQSMASRLLVMCRGLIVEELRGERLPSVARHAESRALIEAMLPEAPG